MTKKTKKQPKNVLSVNNTSSNINFTLGNTTTSTVTQGFRKEFKFAQFVENKNGNFIEMIYEEIPTILINYGYGFTPKKHMLKEIYSVVDGQLKISKEIRGVEEPGYYVEPVIEWNE